MGVHCEINLFKPSDGAFVPGSTVSGVIKYAVDEVTVFKKITLSLKGNGRLRIEDRSKRRRKGTMSTYTNSEEYVNIKNIIHDCDKFSNKTAPVPIGVYEVPFTYTLPPNLPPSLKYSNGDVQYNVQCDIQYYISMKFERPGLFKFDKEMKKEITVVSGIKPRLPMVPTIVGEQKKIFQLFSSKPNILNIKANVESCVIGPGGKVKFTWEILNHTNLNLRSVETKLIEVYTFTSLGQYKVKYNKDIKDTDSKCGSINCGVSLTNDMTIDLPSDLASLDYSNMVSRDYFVQITAEIPFPHWNAHLMIPLQIGDWNMSSPQADDDRPPSYWETMAEDQKQDKDDANGANDESDNYNDHFDGKKP